MELKAHRVQRGRRARKVRGDRKVSQGVMDLKARKASEAHRANQGLRGSLALREQRGVMEMASSSRTRTSSREWSSGS